MTEIKQIANPYVQQGVDGALHFLELVADISNAVCDGKLTANQAEAVTHRVTEARLYGLSLRGELPQC